MIYDNMTSFVFHLLVAKCYRSSGYNINVIKLNTSTSA